jgi:hypothetical protein
MPVKMTGAEWNAFYADPDAIKEGMWHEEEEIFVNGEPLEEDEDLSTLPDEAIVKVVGGVVYDQDYGSCGVPLKSCIRKWRGRQKTVWFACSAPKELAESVKAAITAAGGKIW